nr:glucan endo-1,3-beta-glucosidase, acidic isoform gi9 [Ipomoea batatas]
MAGYEKGNPSGLAAGGSILGKGVLLEGNDSSSRGRGDMTRRHVAAQPRNSGGGYGQSQPPITAPRWSGMMTRPYRETAARKKSRAVWRRAVPSWEKEFCLKATAGMFATWDKFAQAKKYVHLYDKIMRWDDKEAQESFDRSKTLFYAKKFNILNLLEISTPPDPDLYIAEIDWDDSKIDDCDLSDALGLLAIDDREEEMEEREKIITIEDIKPTGWDVEPGESYDPNNLTGLIVGGDSRYWC